LPIGLTAEARVASGDAARPALTGRRPLEPSPAHGRPGASRQASRQREAREEQCKSAALGSSTASTERGVSSEPGHANASALRASGGAKADHDAALVAASHGNPCAGGTLRPAPKVGAHRSPGGTSLRLARLSIVGASAVLLVAAPRSSAYVEHTVESGETLWSIAAGANLTTRALAAANGLPDDARVLTGSTIRVPSEREARRALAAGRAATRPTPLGAYTVRPGDTLSAIAARSHIPVSQLAWMNGLDPSAPLFAGTGLKLPTGAPSPGGGAAPMVAPAHPHPAPGRVTPSHVGGSAATHGVPGSLAAAIARQESGFNNGLVSAANARGVMQLVPGTWQFVEEVLAGRQLDPSSAADNVHAGVMYLGQLLRDTGGDEAAATAAYYQGLSSVRRIGLLPETRRYVANVMALRRHYGP
jgi:soluble lytic murein transglycosylase-like protein